MNFKSFLKTIVVVIAVSFNSFAQESESPKIYYTTKQGYKYLDKAEKLIKKVEFKKARKCLEAAKHADYGFCGNAWSEAYGRIGNLEAEIYIIEKNYDNALKTLNAVNGCAFDADCATRDKLKITALIGKFGVEVIKSAFAAAYKNQPEPVGASIMNEYEIESPEFTFAFHDSCFSKHKKNPTLEEIVKDQDFYSLLK